MIRKASEEKFSYVVLQKRSIKDQNQSKDQDQDQDQGHPNNSDISRINDAWIAPSSGTDARTTGGLELRVGVGVGLRLATHRINTPYHSPLTFYSHNKRSRTPIIHSISLPHFSTRLPIQSTNPTLTIQPWWTHHEIPPPCMCWRGSWRRWTKKGSRHW